MIWFFERQNAKLRYEIRRQADGPGYELVITGPDGAPEIEQYADALSLLERTQALECALREEGWHVPIPAGRSSVPRIPSRRAF